MSQPFDSGHMPLLTRIVAMFLRGDVTVLFIVVSLALGGAALWLTPREEEPQIVVPLADVFVEAPGLSSGEVEQQVARPLEKLLFQIDGVEYVYSMSKPGRAIITVRFYVGEDREDSLVKLYTKVRSNVDQIPSVVSAWVVKPIEVDDVPIVNVTLWTDRTDLYGDHQLRRIAEEMQHDLQAIPNTNRVKIIAGRPRRVRLEMDAQRMASRGVSPLQVADALRASNVNLRSGQFEQQDEESIVEAGTFVGDPQELGDLVVHVTDGRPVYLKDVITVLDGPAEVEDYSWIGFGPAASLPSPSGRRSAGAERGAGGEGALGEGGRAQVEGGEGFHAKGEHFDQHVFPAVHIAVAKRKGTNAVWVADAVKDRVAELSQTLLPDGVHYRITRDYGETANDKVNDLVEGLVVAVLTVIGLIGLVIGWRAAVVVALAVPVCYSLTLFINMMVGYTINRVTMFALILAIGLLVDDPITDVENIARYFTMRKFSARESVLRAVQEVRPALILSTLAIVASFLPLAFITGMMGPYMAPMALNVPLTVIISTVVAFVMTPWLSMVMLGKLLVRREGDQEYDIQRQPLYRLSRAVLGRILDHRFLAWGVLGSVAVLLVAAMALPALRLVPLKMLPYDNKNEFQLVIDMPEGTTLDRTDAVARRLGDYLRGVPEVSDYEVYVGLASPMDFNGMVRHYFLRRGPNVAEVRVNLARKEARQQQSHEILLRIRRPLTELADSMGANVKLVEVPPGPPVLSTITAEVYGPPQANYGALVEVADTVGQRLHVEPGVVDVDTSGEADETKWVFVTDKPKAALSGISTEAIARTLQTSLGGAKVTVLHLPDEVEPLWIELRLPRAQRSAVDELIELYVRGQGGEMVQLSGLGRFVRRTEDKTIYHKNLRRVAYTYAEVAGRPPADAIMDVDLDRTVANRPFVAATAPRPLEGRTWFEPGGGVAWGVPDGFTVRWSGEGEWKITLDVFRDLGLAFGAALVGIFVILMFETKSRVLPLLIMLAIPLSMIGIMPGFWLLNKLTSGAIGSYPNPVFFTATAMIGMIALAGIVVRNSVVLIDFIHIGQTEGLPLREAVIRSVAVRARPIFLTAATTLLGNWVITLDPVFSGLAWAIIFGIFSSTLFTLIVIPVVYWLLYSRQQPAMQAHV